jgi:alanine racemase
MEHLRPSFAEIDLAAISHNTRELKKHAKAMIMAVVKANAYGHGMMQAAQAALNGGADRLGVATPEEALLARSIYPDLPIQVMGMASAWAMPALAKNNIIVTLISPEDARALDAAAREQGVTAGAHLKIDTGMCRIGISPDDLTAFSDLAATLRHVHIEGLFTHFADADNLDFSFTNAQFKLFNECSALLESRGLNISIRHCANSAAILAHPQTCLDMARPGLAMYGINPLPPDHPARGVVHLRPAMRFVTHIGQIKTVPDGSKISYGCAYVCSGKRRVATLPVGYADGLSRLLSNCGEVLVRARRAPIIGRVCMDMCMVDISDIPQACEGDEAVIFGNQQNASIPIEETAGHCRTIPYETLCAISMRVPRVYKEGYC